MPIYTSNNWRIQVSVENQTLDSLSWSKASGGDIAPEGQKATPGGMQPSVAVSSGRRTRNDMVVQREWSDALIAKFIALDNASGSATAKVSMTPLKSSKVTAAKPITYSGILGPVKRPDADSYSSNIEFLELTLWCNEAIS